MKKNRLFRLTDKEIEAVKEACFHAMDNGGDRATLQRAVDKMFVSQWYSDEQLFSPKEFAKRQSAQQGVQPTCATSRRKKVLSKSKVSVGRTRG
jgi:hypothetical protein